MAGTNRVFSRSFYVCLFVGLLVPLKFSCAPAPTQQEKAPVYKTAAPQAIINGTADLTQPAIGALVVQRRSSFCTGTLIAKQVVVTAAHCVDAISRYGLSNVTFRTDFADPNSKFRSEHHELLQVAKHPQYTQNSGASYDIAVMILKKKVQNVTTIPANKTAMDPKWVGTNIKVVGYGLIQTQPSNRSADQKYAADIPLFQISTRSFIHFDNQTPKDQRKSACHGDSGGPALYLVDGKIRVMGVTSIAYQATGTGGGQTLCDGGAVSTRTDANYDFLRPFLQKYGDGPEACKTDTECGACDSCGSKLVCEPKSFPTESNHCKPCKDDNDCGGGICYRFNNGFRCLQACTKDGCCPQGMLCNALAGTFQSTTVCTPETAACPDVTCTDAKDCGPGELCDNGTCKPDLPKPSAELCQPCSDYKACGSGVCYGPQGNGRCTQPCGAGDFCPQGFVCKALYPGHPNQCVPTDGTCKLTCTKDDECPTGFGCLNKYCTRKGGGIHGDSCDPMPCKEGLECVLTASGKNCMQPCGVKAGYGGTTCPSNNGCLGGTRCYTNSGFNVCLGKCSSTDQCAAVGGGTCSQVGNCLCRSQSDCNQGFVCNLFTYSGGSAVGACVPQEGQLNCSSGFECRNFENKEYCVPVGPGNRAVGEECDSLNRCKDGLVCLNTGSSLLCFEDCTNTQTCKLGGSCARVYRSLSICLCDKVCPKGRVCQTAIQGYGVCTSQKQQNQNRVCIDDKDCPQYFDCKESKCVPGTIPTPEPTTEPVDEAPTEAATQDAGTESQPEPAPEPAAEAPSQTEPAAEPQTTPDASTTTDTALPPPPKSGCGCSQTNNTPSPGLPLSAFLLVGLFFIRRRTHA
ncbi:MAG: trypsin-like serine protease [Deltaproteobacteria bacterium]|nr:MAG: trypsin-like serine protease [Deltaproteobacteria bacterium]